MNNKLKPAIIGGVVIGLLSIIPIINLGNICCCLWAILGAIAGAVGGVIVIILGIPISIVAGGITRELFVRLMESINPSQAEMIRAQMLSGLTVAREVVNGIVLAVCLVIFSTLGGLLGVPIFEKRKRDSVLPPPPQGF